MRSLLQRAAFALALTAALIVNARPAQAGQVDSVPLALASDTVSTL